MKLSDIIFKSNIRVLGSYLKNAPDSNKARINEVIKLYEDKKIRNIKTALNTITSLASTNKNTISSGKPLRLYDTVIDKYSDVFPMTGQRRTRNRQEPQQQSEPIVRRPRGRPKGRAKTQARPEQSTAVEDGNQIKEYIIDMIFYESQIYNSNDAERAEQRRARNIKGKYLKGMRQMFLGQYTVRLNILLSFNVEEFFDKWYLKLFNK